MAFGLAVTADTYPGEALINQAFAKDFFNGEDALGKAFHMVTEEGRRFPSLRDTPRQVSVPPPQQNGGIKPPLRVRANYYGDTNQHM